MRAIASHPEGMRIVVTIRVTRGAMRLDGVCLVNRPQTAHSSLELSVSHRAA